MDLEPTSYLVGFLMMDVTAAIWFFKLITYS